MVQPGMNLSETAMPLFPCLAGRLHAFPGSRFRFHSQIASSRSQIFCDLTVMICQWAKLFTQLMRSRMDDLLWRIEWIGGVGYNTSVPSEPQIDVCLAQLPKGEKNPLSARARSSQVEKRTVEDRCWPAALRLDRFRLAEAPARDYESVGVPRSCEH